LLARLAFLQGDEVLADKMYAGIETESDEAKDYLAKQVIARKNWPRARQLTEELIKKHPDQAQCRATLETINKAAAGNKRCSHRSSNGRIAPKNRRTSMFSRLLRP
jgi:hypothetical protein